MPVPQPWKCTSCGGALPRIERDEEFVVCAFCKATNAVVRERPLAAVPARKGSSTGALLIGVATAFILVSLGAWLMIGRAPPSGQSAGEPAGEAARDVAEGAVFRVGERGVLRFEPLSPTPPERHWVTLVPAGSPDSEWGEWRYVEAGATSASFDFGAPGKFELRLHDGYPRLAYHVILRRHFEVR